MALMASTESLDLWLLPGNPNYPQTEPMPLFTLQLSKGAPMFCGLSNLLLRRPRRQLGRHFIS